MFLDSNEVVGVPTKSTKEWFHSFHFLIRLVVCLKK